MVKSQYIKIRLIIGMLIPLIFVSSNELAFSRGSHDQVTENELDLTASKILSQKPNLQLLILMKLPLNFNFFSIFLKIIQT